MFLSSVFMQFLIYFSVYKKDRDANIAKKAMEEQTKKNADLERLKRDLEESDGRKVLLQSNRNNSCFFVY